MFLCKWGEHAHVTAMVHVAIMHTPSPACHCTSSLLPSPACFYIGGSVASVVTVVLSAPGTAGSLFAVAAAAAVRVVVSYPVTSDTDAALLLPPPSLLLLLLVLVFLRLFF